MRKLMQVLNRIGRRRTESAKIFRVLTGLELAAAFGGNPLLLPLEDPDLKPERVQGW
jgi:hypothetical protein